MKAKNYLKQIGIMDARIAADKVELERLRAEATNTTSVLGGERVQSSGSQQKMADAVTDIVALEEKIIREKRKYEAYRAEAKELVFEACDGYCITLLHKKYFQGMSWEEIAVDMNYTYKWVSGGLHQRALSQVQKALDEREGVKNE